MQRVNLAVSGFDIVVGDVIPNVAHILRGARGEKEDFIFWHVFAWRYAGESWRTFFRR